MDDKRDRRLPIGPLPVEWLRGPARIDGKYIVMPCETASSFRPLAEPDVGVELSHVRNPDDAVQFVRRFGLLREKPSLGDAEVREAFAEFEHVAADLHDILTTAKAVRDARAGKAEAFRYLRALLVIPEDRVVRTTVPWTGNPAKSFVEAVHTPARLVGADDLTILTRASQFVADLLNEGLKFDAALPHVFDRTSLGEVEPGSWRIGMLPTTLAGVCYLSVALALVDQVPVGVCEDTTCRRLFFVRDGRQRYCTPRCANRTRYRRFKEKGEATTTEGEQ